MTSETQTVKCCPHCGSMSTIKSREKQGVPRTYFCAACRQRFPTLGEKERKMPKRKPLPRGLIEILEKKKQLKNEQETKAC